MPRQWARINIHSYTNCTGNGFKIQFGLLTFMARPWFRRARRDFIKHYHMHSISSTHSIRSRRVLEWFQEPIFLSLGSNIGQERIFDIQWTRCIYKIHFVQPKLCNHQWNCRRPNQRRQLYHYLVCNFLEMILLYQIMKVSRETRTYLWPLAHWGCNVHVLLA